MGAVWCDHLRDIPHDQALEVARSLVTDASREARRFPNVAEFRTRWRAWQRAANVRQQAALDVPRPSQEQRMAAVAEVRAMLAKVRTATGPYRLAPLPSTFLRPTPDAPPLEWCGCDDHTTCGAGPIRVAKAPST
jgi:hypothetical protein